MLPEEGDNLPVLARALFLLVLAALVASSAAGRTRQDDPVSLSGYVHARWQHRLSGGSWPAYGFELTRARAKFAYELSPVRVCLEVGMDELQPSIRDAFVSWRALDALRFTAGLAKMPFSREELTPYRRLAMADRGLANDRFGRLGYLGRDIGLAIDGDVPLAGIPFGYALGVFNGNGARLASDDNNAKQFVERVTARLARWLELGLNATQRNDSATGKPVMALGGDCLFHLYETTVAAEVLAGESEDATRMLGASLTAAYRIGAFEPALRVERLVADLGDGGSGETELAIGGNWQLHRQVRLQANLVSDFASGLKAEHGLLVQVQGSY